MSIYGQIIIFSLGFFTVGLFIFLFAQLRKLNKNTVIIDYDHAKLKNDKYQCPKCSVLMKPVFVIAGKGIMWRYADDKPLKVFSMIFRCLDNTLNMSASVRENMAFECEDCKFVLIDHSCFVGKLNK